MSILYERILANVKVHTLSLVFGCAVVLLVPPECETFKSDNFHCKLIGNCVCRFENGEGYDLSSLNMIKPGLNASVGNLTFYFHPCTDITIGNISDLNHCFQGASVCLYNHTSQSYINLGLSHEVEVTSDGITGPVAFIYTHNNSVTTVKMNKCVESNSLEIGAMNAPNKYELLLNSPSVCRQPVYIRADPPESEAHLSTGSVLVIMLIVFSSLYFVGGALVLKLLRGAEGREMIPNYDFWVSLPGLVKEGFIFTMSGCHTAQAYDRI